MTWNCKRENCWRAHRTKRGTLLKVFFVSTRAIGIVEQAVTGVFLWRKKFHSWLDKIWINTRKGGSNLKHAKDTPKYFLDKDFVTIWITIFWNPPKKVKSLKSLTSSGACSPISHSAQLPTALPESLSFTQYKQSAPWFFMKALCAFTLCFSLHRPTAGLRGLKWERGRGDPCRPLQWGYWDTNSRNNPPWPLLSSQEISAHLL